jgi:hypothetical protein
MNDSVTLPYLIIRDDELGPMLLASEAQRWRLLDKLLETENRSRDEIPEVWATDPLRAWCWLVLVVNNLEFDPEEHRPLVHWGVDLGFSETPVRNWIWTIS